MGKTKMPILTGSGGTEIKNGQIVEGYALDGEIDAGMFVEKASIELSTLSFTSDYTNQSIFLKMLTDNIGIYCYLGGTKPVYLYLQAFSISDNGTVTYGTRLSIQQSAGKAEIASAFGADATIVSSNRIFLVYGYRSTYSTSYYGTNDIQYYACYIDIANDLTLTANTKLALNDFSGYTLGDPDIICNQTNSTIVIAFMQNSRYSNSSTSVSTYKGVSTGSASTTESIPTLSAFVEPKFGFSGNNENHLYTLIPFTEQNWILLCSITSGASSIYYSQLTVQKGAIQATDLESSKYTAKSHQYFYHKPITMINNVAYISNYAIQSDGTVSSVLSTQSSSDTGSVYWVTYIGTTLCALYAYTNSAYVSSVALYETNPIYNGSIISAYNINKDKPLDIEASSFSVSSPYYNLTMGIISILFGEFNGATVNYVRFTSEALGKTYTASSTSISGVTQEKITATKPGDITILKEGN